LTGNNARGRGRERGDSRNRRRRDRNRGLSRGETVGAGGGQRIGRGESWRDGGGACSANRADRGRDGDRSGAGRIPGERAALTRNDAGGRSGEVGNGGRIVGGAAAESRKDTDRVAHAGCGSGGGVRAARSNHAVLQMEYIVIEDIADRGPGAGRAQCSVAAKDMVHAEKQFVAGGKSGGVAGVGGSGGAVLGGDIKGVCCGDAGILDGHQVEVGRAGGVDGDGVVGASEDVLGVEDDDVCAVDVIDGGLP